MKAFLIYFFLALSVASSAQELTDSQQREIVFHSVNVIPMDRERVVENQVVVVKNGRITAMGEPKKIKYGRDALVIEANGKYLIPGLAEMHGHVPSGDNPELMNEVMLLYALNGITTVRGMLGHPRHLELRRQIQNGEILGPRFYIAGPPLNGQTVKDAASAASMVRSQKEAGYDHLKLLPGLTQETFAAIAKTAKEVNIPFAGHVSFDVGIWRAIEAEYASIDHLDGFIEGLVPGIENMTEQQTGLFGMFVANQADTSQIPKLMSALREHRVWVVPTQALAERWFTPDKTAEAFRNEPEMKYMDPSTLDNWVKAKSNLMANPSYNREAMTHYIALRRKLIYECHKNGVGLLLGSDAPQIFNVPGFSTHHELKYLVDAGLTPYDALRTGTIAVAHYIGKPNDTGTIKTGAVSDLVLLSGNPLQDIGQTKNIEGVMVGSRWLPKAYIDQQLKKLEKK